jgi:hypothetical protein
MASAPALAEELLRNGSFGNGLQGWNLNPRLPVGWDPMAGGGASLSPPLDDFEGVIISQNLNVTQVGGKTIDISILLSKVSAHDSERTVAIYLSFVDETASMVRVKILNPLNSTVVDGVPVGCAFQVPSGVQKLTRIEIARRGTGVLTLQSASLSCTGVVSGPIPVITGVSQAQGPYGTVLTIAGLHFGDGTASGSRVSIGNASAGIGVVSWSDTAIEVIVNEPARSGPVRVVADDVESDPGNNFEVTSPHFTLDTMRDEVSVIRGQPAGFTLKIAPHNGFNAGNIGLALTETNCPGLAGVAAFYPPQVHNQGGSVLRIETTDVTATECSGTVTASAGTSLPRTAPFALNIATVRAINFYESNCNPETGQCEKVLLADKTVSRQDIFGGEEGLGYEVATSDDRILLMESAPVTVGSGDGALVSVYSNPRGCYDMYALANGVTYVTVTAPDGFSATLPVAVEIPGEAPYVASATISPQSVTNTFTGTISFAATGNGPTTFGLDPLLPVFNVIRNASPDGLSETGSFQLDPDRPVRPGIYLFHAATSGGGDDAFRLTPLQVENDPAFALMRGRVASLDTSIPTHTLSRILFEFHDPFTGELAFSSEVSHRYGYDFSVAPLPPGTYRIRYSFPGAPAVKPRWYPNGPDQGSADIITLADNTTRDNVYLFATTEAAAISFSASGFILDLETAEGIPGVTVSAVDDASGTIAATGLTDKQGAYYLTLPSAGAYRITVAKEAYSAPQDQEDPLATIDGVNTSATLWPLYLELTGGHRVVLAKGWNLVSTAVQPTQPSVAAIFADVAAALRVVWAYDGAERAWRCHFPFSGQGTLAAVEKGKGYWILAEEPVTLIVLGTPVTTAVPLREGWNLIGYTGEEGTDVADIMAEAEMNGTWSMLWNWFDGYWYGKHESGTFLPSPVQQLTTFRNGRAYWIRIKEGAGEVAWRY